MKILLMLALMFTVACKKSGDSKVITPSTPAEYGVYETGCIADGSSGTASIGRFYYGDSYIFEESTLYSSSNCSDSYKLITESYTYSYSRNGVALNLSLVSSVGIVHHSSLQTLCGQSWSLNTPKSLIGVDCGDGALQLGATLAIDVVATGNGARVYSGSESFNYSRIHTIDFANKGETLSNGDFSYYDGTNALYLTIATPNFAATFFDADLNRYFTINGTFTSSNNSATFTVVANSQNCQPTEFAVGMSFTDKFSKASKSLALREDDGDILLAKVNYTSTQFRTAFLSGSYSQACF